MKVNVVETKRYESDIKFVDINVISEDEALLYSPRRKIRFGTEFEISKPESVSKWTVFIKNKAFSMTCFEPDEYTEDEVKLKAMLREWAENNGINFGE